MEASCKDGDTIWWTTDGQMCIDTPFCAVERLLPHYCFKYGATAYEFWGVDWLTYDPSPVRLALPTSTRAASRVNSTWVRYPNGDGFLAYPGKPIGHDGPLTSVRLEQARDGVEDYEYLWLLRELLARARQAGRDVAAGEAALAEAAALVEIPNAGGRFSTRILPDPFKLCEARHKVAEAIEALQRQ
jgi:hypothetical protein